MRKSGRPPLGERGSVKKAEVGWAQKSNTEIKAVCPHHALLWRQTFFGRNLRARRVNMKDIAKFAKSAESPRLN